MNKNRWRRTIVFAIGSLLFAINSAWAAADTEAKATVIDNKIDPQLLNESFKTSALQEALISVQGSFDKQLLNKHQHYLDKRREWVNHLQQKTQTAQLNLLSWLREQRVEHRSYWINNTVWVRANRTQLRALAARRDVTFVYANPIIVAKKPVVEPAFLAEATLAGVEWGVNKINAPKVWAAGFTGQGVVIAGEDTGYKWDHPAIKSKYRGWNGNTANHNYNWYDATHNGSASCAPNQKTPCDDNGHGTHTIGTMVGDDGAGNQVGVAPGAKWIGCRNMIGGEGTPARYTECLQWLVAPTDVNGQNPDPSKAPDISSHSWGCTPSEGCTAADALKTAVDNVISAGIMVIAAAGNDGSSCSTITDPPGRLDASLTVGSTTSSDTMSSFSSRGPATGASKIKPDLSAPGSSVRSAWNNDGYNTISGTSMATPHVAGAAALLISAVPALRGKPEQVASLLRSTAVGVSNSQSCGGIGSTTYPNYVAGAGRIDVHAAYLKATGSTVNNPPTAAFTFSVSNLTVAFTDSSADSDGTIASRLWTFGDNTTSTAANPSKTYANAGTYTVVLKVTDDKGDSGSVSKQVTVGTANNVLTNGVPKTGLSGATGSSQTFTLAVPAGATGLKFVTSGGTGDADLYVKWGSAPTTSSYDCRSIGSSNSETCSITTAKTGTYYVLIKGYRAFSGLSLTGSHR